MKTYLTIQPKLLYSNWTKEQLLEFEQRPEAQTGIRKIDERFPFPSGFYILAGSPGSGKGWFALWLSRQFYGHNLLRTVYFSLEMSESLVRTRILQQWSGLTKSQLENGGDISSATNLLSQDVLIVDDFHSSNQKLQTPRELERKIREYYSLGYKVFHFDHLHEVYGANNNDSNQKVMEDWGKMFQQLSKSLKDIWLFVYVQPNGKGYEKNLLKRADISGSKSVVQKCDFFLSLNRDQEVEGSRTIFLHIDKNRYSDVNHVTFQLYFAPTGNYTSTIHGEI